MRYQFCPICGEELTPHDHGKYCRECTAKLRKKAAKRALVVTGVTVAVGTAAVGVALYKNKRLRKRVVKLLKTVPVERSAAALRQTADAAQYKAKELLAQADALRQQAAAQLLTQTSTVREQAKDLLASIDLPF